MADFVDYVFFTRILAGIAGKTTYPSYQQQQNHKEGEAGQEDDLYNTDGSFSEDFLRETDACLARVIGTRNGSLDYPRPYNNNNSKADDECRCRFPSSYDGNNGNSVGLDSESNVYNNDECYWEGSVRFEEEKDEGIFVMDDL